ncbi:MAG TPA: deoxynucleoside kinase [Terriglobales bacterium]|nr:deoxynucleoside kinase [Terriglobales bacterium]
MSDTPTPTPPRYLAIEGPIRVGKSSLARILAERHHAQLLLEPEDNPHLAGFYAGQPGAAFRAQMHFLLQRYRQLAPLGPERPWGGVVADYIFAKDKIFAYINLSDAELAVYNQYYELLRPQIAVPDLVIYLQATPEVLRQRLARRNLASEQEVSDEYLREVVKAYDHFFFRYDQSDLLVINTSEIDFVEQDADLQELMRRLEEPVAGTQYYLPLGS